MNSKERILKAINRETLDRIPCDYWGTSETTNTLKQYLGVEEEIDLWRKLGIDKIVI